MLDLDKIVDRIMETYTHKEDHFSNQRLEYLNFQKRAEVHKSLQKLNVSDIDTFVEKAVKLGDRKMHHSVFDTVAELSNKLEDCYVFQVMDIILNSSWHHSKIAAAVKNIHKMDSSKVLDMFEYYANDAAEIFSEMIRNTVLADEFLQENQEIIKNYCATLMSESVKKFVKLYKDRQGFRNLAERISLVAYSEGQEKVDRNIQILSQKEIVEVIDMYQGEGGLLDTLKSLAENVTNTLCDVVSISEENTMKTVEILKKYPSESAEGLCFELSGTLKDNPEIYPILLRVFEKYASSSFDIAISIGYNKNYDLNEQMLTELLSDEVYNSIESSRNPESVFKNIVNGNYANIAKMIDDKSLELKYEDLDLIQNTYDFVMEFHKHRSDRNKSKIGYGFYEELNRAISQTEDKIEMISKYCKEVKQRMMKNADELMVVTNG